MVIIIAVGIGKINFLHYAAGNDTKPNLSVFSITNFKIFSLRHLVKDTQEQTNRTSRTVQDLSSNVAELTNSVKDLKSEVSDLKDGLKAEIKRCQDMSGDLETQIELVTKRVDRKLIFLKGAL